MKKRIRPIVDLLVTEKDIERLSKGYVVYKMKTGVRFALKKKNPHAKEIKALKKKIKFLSRG